jgi:hypothetical protein
VSEARYRISYEAIENKWIVREWNGDGWSFAAMRNTLAEAEATVAALAHPPSEREYDTDGNLIGVRVMI